MMGTTLLALGHYAPEQRVTNAEIEARLGLEAGWIERRTGIVERRFARDDETLSDLAVAAGQDAIGKLGFDPARIGLVILATSTPDHLLPPSAPLVAERLGLCGAGAIDMAGACGGFMYALTFADAFAKVQGKPVLVIAANLLSRRTNMADRATSILFADAAGAVVVAPDTRSGCGVIGAELVSDGSGYDLIGIEAGGSRAPFQADMNDVSALMEIRDGKAVFSRVSRLMVKAAETALARAGLTAADVTYFIPHQANERIMTVVQDDLGIATERVLSSVQHFGNSSAATIPFTLSVRAPERVLSPGDVILMCAAGAGLTGGAVVFRL